MDRAPILIHVCCAGCFATTCAGLRAAYGDAVSLRGFFFNPNIHPLLEFRRRLKAVRVYTERDPVPVDVDETYGLVPFCGAVHGAWEAPARCRICYRLRLERTARQAREVGARCFTSTLVTSSHQDHALIRAEGERAARAAGVPFLYRDFRQAEAPARLTKGLYRQSYCGCVFSEAERYAETTTHCYKGPGGARQADDPSSGKEPPGDGK